MTPAAPQPPASSSRPALLGAIRSAAQLVSFQVAIGLALVGPLLFARSLSMTSIVEAQRSAGVWFVLFQPIAFAIFFVASLAETNRAPFDLPEAEGELGAGFHTEYSGFKWSMFFMAEYVNMVNVSALAIVLFLGGWWPVAGNFPGLGGAFGAVEGVLGPLVFLIKLALFMFFFIWLRTTLPRLRFDRLMALGWKVLLPVALGTLVLTAVVVALWPNGWWPFF